MTAKLCAICRKRPVGAAYAPFCSKRCADLDLQRWLTGGYVIAGESDEESAPGAASDEAD